MTCSPLLRDPYESRTVEVRPSRVAGGGEGLFARIRIEPNTVMAFYNGQRVAPRKAESQDAMVRGKDGLKKTCLRKYRADF